ncbi:MAG: hypothetical protein M3Z31_10850 [Pseudomonadota bacterium]|nr:hypothetical protein [Pseudomonadota bacterium]
MAAARRARDKARELLSEGRDPVAPRKEAKLIRQAATENTFRSDRAPPRMSSGELPGRITTLNT